MHSEFKQKWGEQMSRFLVTKNGPGTRPATGPDMCFYCRSKVGFNHQPDCVIIGRKATITYTITIEEIVPAHWTEQDVEFNKNGVSCADNILSAIEEFRERRGQCLCDCTKAEVVALHDETFLHDHTSSSSSSS